MSPQTSTPYRPGTIHANSAELPPIPRTGASIVATMKNAASEFSQRAGRGSSVELIPGNPASRTSLEHAVREGLIAPDGNGGYRDVGIQEAPKAAPAVQPQQQQQAQQPQAPRADYDRIIVDATTTELLISP